MNKGTAENKGIEENEGKDEEECHQRKKIFPIQTYFRRQWVVSVTRRWSEGEMRTSVRIPKDHVKYSVGIVL